MPLLSRFTPLGTLSMTGRPSHAQTMFESMQRSQGQAYAKGGLQEAKLYAQAMGLARAQHAMERAGNQQFAKKAADFFEILEREHGVVPHARATDAERRGELAARMLLPGGASQTNIENALRELLGDDFLAYRPTPKTEIVTYPANIGDSPMNMQLPGVLRKRVTIVPAISTGIGAPLQVRYVNTRSDATLALTVGDAVVVDPGGANEERVTVAAIASAGSDLFFTATYSKAHAAGALGITAPYPFWASTKRHSLVVVTESAAADQEKRRKINDLLRRIAREVSTWSIAAEASPGSGMTGPFTVGGGKLGITTIGTVVL